MKNPHTYLEDNIENMYHGGRADNQHCKNRTLVESPVERRRVQRVETPRDGAIAVAKRTQRRGHNRAGRER